MQTCTELLKMQAFDEDCIRNQTKPSSKSKSGWKIFRSFLVCVLPRTNPCVYQAARALGKTPGISYSCEKIITFLMAKIPIAKRHDDIARARRHCALRSSGISLQLLTCGGKPVLPRATHLRRKARYTSSYSPVVGNPFQKQLDEEEPAEACKAMD